MIFQNGPDDIKREAPRNRRERHEYMGEKATESLLACNNSPFFSGLLIEHFGDLPNNLETLWLVCTFISSCLDEVTVGAILKGVYFFFLCQKQGCHAVDGSVSKNSAFVCTASPLLKRQTVSLFNNLF